jgi:hypothetical protein
MARTTFSGPVISKNGFINTGPNMTNSTALADGTNTIVNKLTIPAVATEILASDIAGRLLLRTDADAATVILPAILSGANSNVAGETDYDNTNNIGISFKIIIGVTVTGSFILKVADAATTFTGFSITGDDLAATHVGFVHSALTTAGADTLTLNGGTTGGLEGAIITATAISATQWDIQCTTNSNGAPVKPWSATV